MFWRALLRRSGFFFFSVVPSGVAFRGLSPLGLAPQESGRMPKATSEVWGRSTMPPCVVARWPGLRRGRYQSSLGETHESRSFLFLCFQQTEARVAKYGV